MRAFTALFFGLALAFSVRYALRVDWRAVGRALAALPVPALLAAAALAAASHAVYASFDLLGRRYTGHRLRPALVMQVTFISYAFNLNMGSLVGGVGFRLRLYSQLGLDVAAITQVMSLSLLTNWLGYLAWAGALFTFMPPPLPPTASVDSAGLRALGLVLLSALALYLALCLGRRRHHLRLRLRGHKLPLPPPRLVGWQLALSCANWACMGAVVWALLQGQVPFFTVLAVMLVSAAAGILTHVPANLGVLEAVFLALLSHRVAEPKLLAALLAYRALYYLLPWALATGLYLLLESRLRVPARPG